MKYPTNPILEFFGFGKPKLTKDGQDLITILKYIQNNVNNDPEVRKDAEQLDEMGLSIYSSKYAYTNLVLCWITVQQQMVKYKMSPNDLAAGSRSAKRLLQWGRKKGII